MFGKKYIFETRKTKFRRDLFNFGIAIFLLSLVYLGFCFFSIYVSRMETKIANDAFYQKSPDLIAVFTGDMGRIPYGIQKAVEFKNVKILISGVYNTSTIQGILETQSPETLKLIDLNSNFIEIDYLARNTIENVISTLRYLRKEQNLKKILIVSSDYHILRIKFILQQIKSNQDSFQFNYIGIESDYSQWRNIKILLKEAFKGLKAFVLLTLWDNNNNNGHTL